MATYPRTNTALAISLASLLTLSAATATAQVRRDELLTPGSTPATGDSALSPLELAQRLERLERMLNDKSLSDFVLQLQQLQQEVQDLRGQVELHQYQLRQVSPGLPQLGESYAAAKEAAEAAAGEDTSTGADTAVDGQTAAGADASAGQETTAPVPVAPPPKTGVGALGAGGDSGGTLALPTPETLEGNERDAYRDAFERLKDRDYEAAKKAFAAMLVRYPDGQFADNGVYWLGEIGYVTKDYAAALTHFNRLISDYPGSPKLPSAMLKLGYVYSDQQELEQARRMLEAVTERFPDTTEGRLAKGRLEQMTRDGG
jgi:tol-pal system protein YbgF